MDFNEDTIYQTIQNMETYGGSFVKQLAKLYTLGDGDNKRKLLITFNNYFQQYHPENWGR